MPSYDQEPAVIDGHGKSALYMPRSGESGAGWALEVGKDYDVTWRPRGSDKPERIRGRVRTPKANGAIELVEASGRHRYLKPGNVESVIEVTT